MSAGSHATRTGVRTARGQSVDYRAKNAGRRSSDGRAARRKLVARRRLWRGPNIPPPGRIRGER